MKAIHLSLRGGVKAAGTFLKLSISELPSFTSSGRSESF
jgi:hypothetical protein